MLKKLNAYLFGIKSSVCNKPMALIILLLVVSVTVISCGFITRAMLQEYTDSLNTDNEIMVGADAKIEEMGDALLTVRESGAFGTDYGTSISYNFSNVPISFEDKTAPLNGDIIFDVFGNYFTDEEIANRGKLIVLSFTAAKEIGCKAGDKLKFANNTYTVKLIRKQEAFYKNDIILMIPYTAAPVNVKYDNKSFQAENNESLLYWGRINFDLKRIFTNSEKAILTAANMTSITHFSYPMIMISFLLVAFIVLAALNLLFVLRYWEKVNSKKFAVLGIVGAKKSTVSGMMLFEIYGVTAVGLGVGLLIDFLVTRSINAFEFPSELIWVHYAVTVLTVLITVSVSMLFKIIKRRKAAPIDRRMYS